MADLRLLPWLLLAAASPALSQPVQLSESEFEALAAGKPRIVEDFNRFPSGSIQSPVTLLNGEFSGSPSIGAPWCLESQCLNLNLATGVFSNLPARSQMWSARLIPAGAGGTLNNVYDFDVVGGGGTQRFTLVNVTGVGAHGAFVGFQDPRGIQRVTVSLRSGGTGLNYSLDDVTVATGSPAQTSVPVGGPVAGLLFALALMATAAVVLRRR